MVRQIIQRFETNKITKSLKLETIVTRINENLKLESNK